MAIVKVEGIDELLLFCQIAQSKADRHIGRAIYPAAGYVMQEVVKHMNNIVTDDSPFWLRPYRLGPTKKQKEWMIKSAGIAKLKHKRTVIDVKIGFDGYMPIKSTTSKNGLQPVALIARSVNKGTSFMAAQPFMDLAIQTSEKQAVEIMDKALNEELEKAWDRYGPR